MSKAILVIDMPNSCDECRLASLVGRSEVMCAIDRLATRKYEDACKERPDWCPLKPVPEKKEEQYMMKAKTTTGKWFDLGMNTDKVAVGFNQCIDEILKGESV